MTPNRALVAAALILFGPFARGQEKPPAAPHVLTDTLLDPDAVRRVAERLRTSDSLEAKSVMQDLLQRIARDPNELSRLTQNNPLLSDPATLQQIRSILGENPTIPQIPGLPSGIGNQFQPPAPPGRPPTPPPVPNSPSRTDPPAAPPPAAPQAENAQTGLSNSVIFAGERRWKASGVERESARRQQQLETVKAFWEKNVGPLDRTPAVRDLMREMIAGPRGLDPKTAAGLASLLADPQADPDGFVKWAANASGTLGDLNLPNLGVRPGDWNLPSFTPDFGALTPTASSPSFSAGEFSGEASWLPVILLVVVAAAALVLWRFWPQVFGTPNAVPLPGLGPWPVDPRHIADRDALIRAFEYLSVLVCGAGARAWNHVAIADALEATTGAADAAEPLARLYELARYAPAGEPLPPEALAEARQHLCRLAGVSPA